jgi:hypothetical protein
LPLDFRNVRGPLGFEFQHLGVVLADFLPCLLRSFLLE